MKKNMTKEEIEKKRHKEEYVVRQMIELYCKKNHHPQDGCMCQSCKELADYATQRSEHCPFMENKTFCANCKIHCYKPEMREKIREVMRFSGPRIVFYHPFMATWHVITSKREKRKLAEKSA